MVIAYVIVAIAIAAYLLRSWSSLCRAYIHVERFRAWRAVASTPSAPVGNILVLIPLHNESRLITSLHSTLVHLCTTIPPQVRIYLLTSNRERDDQCCVTTRSALTRLQWPPQVRLWHSDTPCVGKGTVLNAFLRTLPAISSDTWIAVYDADSIPEHEIFAYVLSLNKHISIVQQPTAYLCDYDKLPRLQRHLALYQTMRSLGTETGRIEAYRTCGSSGPWFLVPYLYLVGHGLFVRYATLTRLGLFPPIYEDLRLGIPALLSRETLAVAPYVDTCLFPERLWAFVRQSMNWCNGSWFIWSDLWSILRGHGGAGAARAVCLTMKGTVNNVLWSVEGVLVYTALMMWLFCPSAWPCSLGMLLLLLGEGFALYCLQRKYSRIIPAVPIPSWRHGIGLVATAVVRPLVYSVGPLAGTLRFLLTLRPNTTWAGKSSGKSRASDAGSAG
jgi:hypothetical protein